MTRAVTKIISQGETIRRKLKRSWEYILCKNLLMKQYIDTKINYNLWAELNEYNSRTTQRILIKTYW